MDTVTVKTIISFNEKKCPCFMLQNRSFGYRELELPSKPGTETFVIHKIFKVCTAGLDDMCAWCIFIRYAKILTVVAECKLAHGTGQRKANLIAWRKQRERGEVVKHLGKFIR